MPPRPKTAPLAVTNLQWVRFGEHRVTLSDGRVFHIDHPVYLNGTHMLLNVNGDTLQVPVRVPKDLMLKWRQAEDAFFIKQQREAAKAREEDDVTYDQETARRVQLWRKPLAAVAPAPAPQAAPKQPPQPAKPKPKPAAPTRPAPKPVRVETPRPKTRAEMLAALKKPTPKPKPVKRQAVKPKKKGKR
jgi:hypothetical protein